MDRPDRTDERRRHVLDGDVRGGHGARLCHLRRLFLHQGTYSSGIVNLSTVHRSCTSAEPLQVSLAAEDPALLRIALRLDWIHPDCHDLLAEHSVQP